MRPARERPPRSEEHTSELQCPCNLVCRLLLFNDTATTEIYTFPYTTLFRSGEAHQVSVDRARRTQRHLQCGPRGNGHRDRKSTRLNSSALVISYAVFCFLMIRRPPRSTLFPTRRSSDLVRPTKYLWIEHAERNAICNAARAGTATEGCTIYVEIMPCMDCARAVVQAGITQVVIAAERMTQYSSEYYNEHFGMVEVLFREAKVAVRRV